MTNLPLMHNEFIIVDNDDTGYDDSAVSFNFNEDDRDMNVSIDGYTRQVLLMTQMISRLVLT